MARGRMINKEICGDKKIHTLSCDTSRLAFTWLVAHADKEGRVRGDPAMVRSMIFPRRDDVTLAKIEGYIQEWVECGLVVWYEANDDMWIWFQGFEKNQLGLRKEKEPESVIPPLADDCRILGGQSTDKVRLKGREGKGRSSPIAGEADVLPGEVPNPPETKPRKANGKDLLRGELEDYFSRITGIAKPKQQSTAQKKAAARAWWNPLRDILDLTDWDFVRAKALVMDTYREMNADELTIAEPRSILKVAVALAAKSSTNGSLKLGQ